MYRYIFIATFSFLLLCGGPAVFAQAEPDTTTEVKKVKKPDSAGHQLCLGVDLVNPVMNGFYKDRYGYEFHADYYLRKEFYLIAEGGWGGSTVNFTDLKYTTTNNFFQFGFNKSILGRDSWKDWDMMLFGLRVGMANVTRSSVAYTIVDPIWGNTPEQTLPGKSYAAFWAGLTGGMRVELVKGLFAGWNIHGKFLMNGKSFRDLSPLYIAGFGKGDKNANFTFNLYISYGIRWKRSNGSTLPTGRQVAK